MRSFLLAAKIAGVFTLVMFSYLIVTLHLFAKLVMHGDRPIHEAHHDFVVTVLWIGLGAIVLVVALSVYVTGPLRRMSRSMDRIAAGDLEHRVTVRGGDEGAAMGRSFNAMAERVRGMIVGQKELIAGISHELRSPLTRMKVSAELLREGRAAADRVADLEADIDTMDGMVEELLLASRFDLGTVPLEPEALGLDELCRAAWERVRRDAEARGAKLQLRPADDASRVLADRGLAVRLLGNLFENSVRYADGGDVTVSSERRGGRIHVSVADEGPGVAADDLDRLFEPFFRADRSRSRKTGAGGLGLMIVRRAVEAHGGSVAARQASPDGLVVSFDLPAPGE